MEDGEKCVLPEDCPEPSGDLGRGETNLVRRDGLVLSALDVLVSGPSFIAPDKSLSFHSFFLFHPCLQGN